MALADQPINNNEDDKPIWRPSDARKNNSHLAAFQSIIEEKYETSFSSYRDIWKWSNENRNDFWSEVWDFCGVIGDKGDIVGPDTDKMSPGAKFFTDSKLNYAENILKKNDDDLAMVFRGEDKVERTLTFKELNEQVSQFTQGLIELGVKKGDRVCGFMPNMPETIIAMLATASLGAIWSSASPDFGTQGVLDRFGQIEPKVMIACAAYYYNGKAHDCMDKLKEISDALPSLENIILVPYAKEDCDATSMAKAILYNDFVASYPPSEMTYERVNFNDPLVIMFSSGTTGIPKCIVHGHGGTLIQHLKEFILQCDTKEGDRVFYFTTCGWMMWNWLVSALACHATLLLYDGSPFYPSGNVLFDYAQDHKMTLFGTASKFIDAVKKEGLRPAQSHDLSSIKTMTYTGSPLVHESFDFVYSDIKDDIHLCALYGGTDIIAASFGIGNPYDPVYRGELQGPGLATKIDVFDADGNPLPAGEQGDIVCRDFFPSMPVEFWDDKNNERYFSAYFDTYPNIWHHGDWVEKTRHGGLIVHGRSDATLNPGGVRIGTAEIYRQVEQIPEVIESLAVGQDWDDDVRVVLFVRLREGIELDEELTKKIRHKIRTGASPRHMPAKVIAITDIPKTKSGKMVEIAVRNVIHNRPVKNVEALANPEALELYKDIPALQN